MTKTIDNEVRKTFEMIFEDAKRYLEKSGDDKFFVYPDEFLIVLRNALDDGVGIGRGAVRLNKLQGNMINYVHEVIYKGINFITATPKKIKLYYED